MDAPTLPADMMLSSTDRSAMLRAISIYRTALAAPTASNSDEVATELSEVLRVALFLAWPAEYGMTAEQSAARTLRYLAALSAVPVWAVQEAINRWARGEWKLEFGESFQKIPSSATLKRIADHVVNTSDSELYLMQRIEKATAEPPKQEVSPAERARIGQKLQELAASMKTGLETARPNEQIAEIARMAREPKARVMTFHHPKLGSFQSMKPDLSDLEGEYLKFAKQQLADMGEHTP